MPAEPYGTISVSASHRIFVPLHPGCFPPSISFPKSRFGIGWFGVGWFCFAWFGIVSLVLKKIKEVTMMRTDLNSYVYNVNFQV